MRPCLVLVVVPVNNEEALLPRCLTHLHAAMDELQAIPGSPSVDVTLVLDNCTDDSNHIAAASRFAVTAIEAGNVGAARAHGIRSALRRYSSTDPRTIWIANTDADSAVPRNWLARHVDAAASGHDLLIGTVRPDFADLNSEQRAAWTATHSPGVANGHVHGANLGIRADRYIESGGFARVPEHEDVGLVERVLRRRGHGRMIATDDCCVLTSGRSEGRTPGGYARHLTEDLLRRETA